MDPWLFVVDALAVYRLTRLIVRDSLLDPLRWWILNRWPTADTTFPDNLVVERHTVDKHWVGKLVTGVDVWLSTKTDDDGDPLWEADRTYKATELIECGFCASIWIAFGVVALRQWWGWWQYPALALALAGVVALIFARWDTE
jgi:hypothetical protein